MLKLFVLIKEESDFQREFSNRNKEKFQGNNLFAYLTPMFSRVFQFFIMWARTLILMTKIL